VAATTISSSHYTAGNIATFSNTNATGGYGVAIAAGGTASTNYALVIRNPTNTANYFELATGTGEVGNAIFTPAGGGGGTFSSTGLAVTGAVSAASLSTFSAGIAVTTGGIQFPATQSASADANTLDDYEEGSGTLAGGGAEITMSTSGTVTAAGDYWYTKVGNVCHFQFEISTSAISSPVGTIRVALPFATAAAAYSAGAIRIYSETFTGSPFIGIAPSTSYLSFSTSISGAGTGNITPTAGTRYYFGEVTYRTA
jgi:hypothetical protein